MVSKFLTFLHVRLPPNLGFRISSAEHMNGATAELLHGLLAIVKRMVGAAADHKEDDRGRRDHKEGDKEDDRMLG